MNATSTEATRKLYVLEETGATFVFPSEDTARQAVADELGRGQHIEELRTIEVPAEDHATYARAVEEDELTAHLSPVFDRATSDAYRAVRVERFCAGACAHTGDTDACATL